MKQGLSIFSDSHLETTPLLEGMVEKYLANSDLNSLSRSIYRRRLRRFVNWIKSRGIIKITRDDIVSYRSFINDELSSPYSVRAYLVAVRSFFSWLEAERLSPNLAQKIKGPRKPKGFRKDPLTALQVKRLLASFDRTRPLESKYFAMMNLMIRTGLRSIEVSRANVGDIQLLSGQYVLWVQGKGSDSKDEFVILTTATLQPIFSYLATRQNPSQEEPLFSAQSSGGRLSTRTISKTAKESFAKIGISSPRITAHSTRHTFVTLSLLAGNSLQETQKAARHSDISSTLIYSQAIKRLSGDPENRLDNYLDSEEIVREGG